MLERDIEDRVCRYAERKGLLQRKFQTPARRSAPDRIFLHKDHPACFFIEFKATGKQPTPKQWREIKRLQNHGHHAYVCDNVEEGQRIIDSEVEGSALWVSRAWD